MLVLQAYADCSLVVSLTWISVSVLDSAVRCGPVDVRIVPQLNPWRDYLQAVRPSSEERTATAEGLCAANTLVGYLVQRLVFHNLNRYEYCKRPDNYQHNSNVHSLLSLCFESETTMFLLFSGPAVLHYALPESSQLKLYTKISPCKLQLS